MANMKEDYGGYVGLLFIIILVATMAASLLIEIIH